MLTYLLHERIFMVEDEGKFTFPNDLKLSVKLSPPEAFGSSDGKSRLIVHGRKTTLLWNANNGRTTAQSEPALEPLEIILKTPNTNFSMRGDTIEYTQPCNNIEEAVGCVAAFQFVLPVLLNIDFADPPVIDCIKGSLGEVNFIWQHKGDAHQFRPRTTESLEQWVVDSHKYMSLFSGVQNRRLVAALHYFHICSRLLVSGNGPWEFMAEAILNLCKVLEILFGSRDDVRIGLGRLGYDKGEIEGDFIPIMLLRDSLDVAHPRLTIFEDNDLTVFYKFLYKSEDRFRDLLKRVLTVVSNGSFELPQEDELELSDKERREMEKVMNVISERNED